MITWIDFIKECMNLPTGDNFSFFIENAVNELHNKNINSSIDGIKSFFREANKNNNISTIAIGIRDCIEYCEKRNNNITNENDKNKTQLFLTNLKYISDEIPRIIEESQIDEQSNEEERLKTHTDAFDKKIQELQGKIKQMEDDIETQNETIDSKAFQLIINTVSILGIFAAVVLTFNVGVSFTTEALNNFMQSSTYHSVLVILLFGFIIGNVVFALFLFLRGIHKEDSKEKLKETTIGKVMIIFNLVLAFLLIVDMSCWFLGFSEYRDERIASKYNSEQTTIEQTVSEVIDIDSEDALK